MLTPFPNRVTFLALAAALFMATPAWAAKKVALVIGNGAYTEAPLKNPPNDARAIAATLRRQGFEVLLKENATKAQMNEVVADFGEKLGEGDTALFFFAGHGMQVQGRNYLIPTDARISSEQRVRLETLDVEAVLDQMAAARARVSMVILDACRNNPFERRFRSVGGGLAQINAPEGTMIAYATSPGKVAADGEGSNGLYTQELLKALAQPGLKVEDVFKQVRINVLKASDNQQIPWESSSLTGEFYFKPEVRSQLASVDAAATARERAELQKALEDERRRREQDAKTQADLQRSLDEERRRRDQDAESVRREMENLRKELLALRQTPSTPPQPIAPPSNAAATTLTPAPASPIPATNIALLNTNAGIESANAARNVEWDRRIELIEKYSDRLTYSKAFALLLDITNADDLTALVAMDRVLNQMGWPIAHSFGVRTDGQPVWSTSTRKATLFYAQETVLDACQSQGSQTCKVIFANGEFRKKDLIELARAVKIQDVNALRDRYLQTLKAPPRQSQTRESSGAMSQLFMPQTP